MSNMPDIEEVLPRVVFTPAERGVLVEQAEALKVSLRHLIEECEKGSGESVARWYVDIARHMEYVGSLVTSKLSQTAWAMGNGER